MTDSLETLGGPCDQFVGTGLQSLDMLHGPPASVVLESGSLTLDRNPLKYLKTGAKHWLFQPELVAVMFLHGIVLTFAILSLFDFPRVPALAAGFYAALLLATMGMSFVHPKELLSVNILDLLFVAFLALCAISLVIRGGLANLDVGPKFLPFLMVAPYLCGRLVASQRVGRLVTILLFVVLLICLLGFLDTFKSEVVFRHRWSFFGLSYGPLLLAGAASTGLIVCLSPPGETSIGVRSRTWQLAQFPITIVLAAGVVALLARGWTLSLIVSLGAMALVHMRRSLGRGAFFLKLGIVAVSMCVSYFTLSEPAQQFLNEVGPTTVTAYSDPLVSTCVIDQSNSISVRVGLYREALHMFLNNPLFGVGAGRYGVEACAIPGSYPHSTILQSLAELGLVGGILICGLVGGAGVALAKRSLDPTPIGAAYLAAFGLLVVFFVSDQFYGNYFMSAGTWLLAGVASASLREKRIS